MILLQLFQDGRSIVAGPVIGNDDLLVEIRSMDPADLINDRGHRGLFVVNGDDDAEFEPVVTRRVHTATVPWNYWGCK